MLQKSIRRGEEENALAAAYEMYVTSPDYLDMLWKRLVCISVEDVGFGEPYAVRFARLNSSSMATRPSSSTGRST